MYFTYMVSFVAHYYLKIIWSFKRKIYKKQNKNVVYHSSGKNRIFLKKHAMQRVFANLIDNALAFATKVYISSSIDDEYLLVTIEDNGPGIPINERENVFRPFYRIEGSRNNETGGIGLGLSIVLDIISNHGGKIELSDSENLGGLKVSINLPC